MLFSSWFIFGIPSLRIARLSSAVESVFPRKEVVACLLLVREKGRSLQAQRSLSTEMATDPGGARITNEIKTGTKTETEIFFPFFLSSWEEGNPRGGEFRQIMVKPPT